MAGVAEHEATIPDDLVAALRRRADELAVPLGSVLLAAHAKVLAALSGEPRGGDRLCRRWRAARRCRAGWRPGPARGGALLLEAHGAEAQLLSHKDFPVDDLRARAGRDRAVVRDRVRPGRRWRPGDGGGLAAGTVLWVGIWPTRRPAGAAAAVPDRRARRGLRGQDRRLSPDRARADRRRSGCRARAAEPAVGRGTAASSSKGSPGRAGSCRTAGSTSCSSSRLRRTRTPSRPCTATGNGPTGSSTPGPTGWAGLCWRGGCAAKAWSRW